MFLPAGPPGFRNHCLNGGVCFQMKNLGNRGCICQHGFGGPRCEYQNPIIARSTLKSKRLHREDSGTLPEHSFLQANMEIDVPVNRQETEAVMGEGSSSEKRSSSTKTVFEEENLMARARRQGEYGFLQTHTKRNHRLNENELNRSAYQKFSRSPSKDHSALLPEITQLKDNISEHDEAHTLLTSLLPKILKLKQQQQSNERLQNILASHDQRFIR